MSKPSGAILITGCSSGIGEETARRLATGGWNVYASARRPESIESLKQAGAKTLALDVTDDESMRAAVAAVEEAEGGAIYGLVNNAGYSQSGAVESVPVARVRDQLETNVVGLIRMCQLVLPGMRKAGEGRIVNVGSMGGRLTFPGGGIYHASKYAVEAVTDALRFEVRGFGVKVALMEPGLIVTNFAEAANTALATAGPSEDESGDPYAKFNGVVGSVTENAYKGPLKALGGGPEKVAKAIERALSSRRPKTRYRVTPSAGLSILSRRATSDRAWDAFMRAQFPTPGA